MEYQQNFGLATSVPIVTPAGGVFGLGLNMVGDEPTLIRSLLLHCVQRTVTIFADRSNETRRVGDRAGGSMTIGRKDKLNCKDDAQYVALYNNSAWMVQLERLISMFITRPKLFRVVIDATYTDYAVPLVAFRPGQPYTLAPKSFTDTFFYKTGAKPIGNGTVWAIDMSAGFNPVKIKFFFPQNVILQLEGMDYVIMV
jgi:hypothetical protein